jgi:dephospho-CoA kinase
MTTLGITGGIGSGKTAACEVFETLGAEVFYADAEAKRLMTEHDGLRTDIIEAFGTESYGPGGTLNRDYLARTVFADPAKIEQINALVHPHVHEAFDERRQAVAAAGHVPLLVHEAALIYESGGAKHLDAVAVVDAPEAERIRRVTERDGATEAEVRARMAHQMSAAEKRRRADYVIDNGGSPAGLRAEVERVFEAAVRTGGT